MHNAGALLPELVNDGIRLLLYAGEADMSEWSFRLDICSVQTSTASICSILLLAIRLFSLVPYVKCGTCR